MIYNIHYIIHLIKIEKERLIRCRNASMVSEFNDSAHPVFGQIATPYGVFFFKKASNLGRIFPHIVRKQYYIGLGLLGQSTAQKNGYANCCTEKPLVPYLT